MREAVLADLRSAWRGVVAAPWASLSAVAALALGMAACLAAAAIVYAGLLRPLPVPDGEQLVSIRKVFIATSIESGARLIEFADWRDRMAGTAQLAAYATERTTLRANGRDPQEVRAAYITGEWFAVLGGRAAVGRLIDDAAPVDEAVVSHALAVKLAAARGGIAASALDSGFTLGGRPLRVVGVLPARLSAIDAADVWVSARGVAALTPTGATDVRNYQMIARAKTGRSIDQVRGDAARVLQQVVPENQRAGWRINVRSLRDTLMGDSRPFLQAFLAAATLVLLVACANVAMLLVNRAVARTREFSVRLALGASRGRLVRTAVLETSILAIAGAAAGGWLAQIAVTVLGKQSGLDLPPLATFTASQPLVGGALALTLFVVIACGTAPVLSMRQVQLATSLRAPASTGSRSSRRLRAALVVSQMTMAVVLLTGAALLGRTLIAVSHVDIGLNEPRAVVTLPVPLGQSTIDPAARVAMPQRIVEDVRRLPGVTSAGIGAALPPSTGGMVFTIRVSTSDSSKDATRAFDLVPATPGYLETIGARLVQGRFFTEADMTGDPVAVMSESALRHLAMVIDTALDRQLNLPLPTATGPRVKPRIIGVIRDVKYSGMDAPAHGGIYVPWTQLPLSRAFVTARTTGDPRALAAEVTRAVRAADPSLPLEGARAFDEVIDTALAPRAARFGVVGVFAGSAVLLAFVGLSGALIRSVVERQRELAIRAAIGATPQSLVVSVLRQGAFFALAGVTIGLVLSAALARSVSTLFYGVTPRDPLTYAATAIAVFAVAIIACYVPARRAAAADPLLLLRSE